MKKTFKTLLALLLALTLVCALFIPVWADDAASDGNTGTDDTTAADNNGGNNCDNTCDPQPTCNECPADQLEVDPPAPVDPTLNPDCMDCFQFDFVSSVSFIKDYSKWYKLGTMTLGECALIKVYILNEDGTLYASKIDIKEHHNRKVDIYWNGLSNEGCHPAGSWNNPATVRFTLTVIATDIDGFDHYWGTWFYYKYYDNDRPCKTAEAAADAPAAANGGKGNADVPHTGL